MMDNKKRILFDSATVHFSPSVFLYQFFLHLSFPLIIPLHWYRYGWISLYAQAIVTSTYQGMIFSWFISLAALTMVIAAINAPENIGNQILFPICLVVMHRLMVSLKYATLSATEYRRILTGTLSAKVGENWSRYPTREEVSIVEGYQRQLQLLTGWSVLSEERLVFEVFVASTICGNQHIDHFHVPDPLSSDFNALQYERWKTLLDKYGSLSALEKDEKRGGFKVGIIATCLTLMKSVNHPHFSFIPPLLSVLGLFNGAIPYIFVFDDLYSMSIWGHVYYMSACVINVALYITVSLFMYTALVDIDRRREVSDFLGEMVRLVDLDMRVKLRMDAHDEIQSGVRERQVVRNVLREQDTIRLTVVDEEIGLELSNSKKYNQDQNILGNLNNGSVVVPQLAETHADNFLAWMYCRTLLHAFGHRLRFRLDIYTGGVILAVFSLLLGLLYFVISAEERKQVIYSSEFIQLVMWIVVFSTLQAAIIMLGHLTNSSMHTHGRLLSQRVLALQYEVNACEREGCQTEKELALRNALSSTSNILDAIRVMDETQPIQVLGIRSEGRTAVMIMYSLGLFVFAVFQYTYFGTLSDV
mmetsp:Transcript_766/g.1273  ORF Transcript_766/g.1273 Transcript_766/m.1273 type:complete len:587 (-) Transcript_766:111-1871(-)